MTKRAAGEEGVCLGGADEVDGGTWRGAEGDERRELGEAGIAGSARGRDQVEHVLLDPSIHVDPLDALPRAKDVVGMQHRARDRRRAVGHAVEHGALIGPGRDTSPPA